MCSQRVSVHVVPSVTIRCVVSVLRYAYNRKFCKFASDLSLDLELLPPCVQFSCCHINRMEYLSAATSCSEDLVSEVAGGKLTASSMKDRIHRPQAARLTSIDTTWGGSWVALMKDKNQHIQVCYINVLKPIKTLKNIKNYMPQ